MPLSLDIGKKIQKVYKLDVIDQRIISLLLFGSDHKNISSTLHIALSTVQRRTRNILHLKIRAKEYNLNCKILGISKILLHIYLRDGNLKSTAEKISEMDGIISVALTILFIVCKRIIFIVLTISTIIL